MATIKTSPVVLTLSALALGASATNCLVLNESHCALRGGDAWCRDNDLGSACVYKIDGSLGENDGHGCYTAPAEEIERHGHVKYGLPRGVFNAEVGSEPGDDDLTTIEGQYAGLVRQEILRAECGVAFDDLRAQVEDAQAFKRESMPKQTKTARNIPYLSAEERERIIAIVEAIDAAFEPCLADGTETETDTDGTTTGGETETMGETETTTGPMPCMGNEDCPDAAAPLCEPMSGECVDCNGVADGDVACAELDAQAPLCVEGACVACTAEDPSVCEAQGLVCDEATSSCVPCTEHEQCGEAACNLFEGTCLPADAVVHVGAGQAFATLTDAVGSFGAGAQGTIVVHGNSSFDEALTVDGGRVLAFLANSGDLPRWVLTGGGSSQLTVTDGTVLMDGLQVSGNASSMDAGVLVNGGRAWLDRSRVIDNNGGGIVAQGAAELVLRNCFVGQAVSNVDALRVDGSTARVVYSTLGGGAFNAFALECVAPIEVTVRNSILVTEGGTPPDEVNCPTGTITFSAAEGTIDGMGNQSVGLFPGGMADQWFLDYAAGDYRLQNDGLTVFADIAQWHAGDPTTDINGDPRPLMDGAMDFAGADVP